MGRKVVVSLTISDEVPDLRKFTGQEPVEAYEDQYALRLVYDYGWESVAKSAVNMLLVGSPAVTAAMVPDFRAITLMRWMNQYPGVVLIFQEGNDFVIPVPAHQRAAGSGWNALRIGDHISRAIQNGFSVLILDSELVPNPAPNICSYCGVETDDPAGQAWFTIGHPTTDGPLPYPICEDCGLVAKIEINALGALTLASNIPETTGYKIRAMVPRRAPAPFTPDAEVARYWSGQEGWTKGGMIFSTPRGAKDYISLNPDVFKKLLPVLVPHYTRPEPG